ncbi:sulfatase-like hydrolase/transferase [Photobacterium sp. SDRW27]|uniref:sulfatase family protein n=1 Tax=Photobacterium obscurum TaxID=2829490 RepID=UPI002244824B|nr:sulfatase-like hydrolase/transferase [Photobacterium obscurum]MCW8329083.1 sulfatase-like hydrolase/transferase [Photobacterium obscurum]
MKKIILPLILLNTAIAHAEETRMAPLDESKPNIVVIYSDDQGWGDVGYHGYDDIRTPNIDKLAAQGTQFSQAYVSASVCGPSRAGLITGVYQQRFGYYSNGNGASIPRSQPTFLEMMKSQGYTTGVVGKWHLGSKRGHPVNRGADFYYGFLNGFHDYDRSDTKEGGKPGQSPIYRNFKVEPPIQKNDGYLTEMFTNEAVDFIERSAEKPFILYLAYNAVHHPWGVPERYLERLKDLDAGEERKLFAGMLLAMDDGVGAVMDTLKNQGLDENTLVFFMSDNGSPREQGLKKPKIKQRDQTVMSSPGPFNGFKGDTYEGGIRVPFVMRWPNKIPQGLIYDKPVINLDIAATMLARTGVTTTSEGFAFDGVDLLPYITGKTDKEPHQTLYWRRDDDYAIRRGNWKLTWNDQSGPQTIRLFNLDKDPGEYEDVSGLYPEVAQDLQNQFDAWDSKLPPNSNGRTVRNRNEDYQKGSRVDVRKFNAEVRARESK